MEMTNLRPMTVESLRICRKVLSSSCRLECKGTSGRCWWDTLTVQARRLSRGSWSVLPVPRSRLLILNDIQKLLDQDKRNHEAYIKSGEIFEDRQHAYEKMTRAVERLTNGVQTLADLLGLAAPVLPTAAGLTKGGLQIVDSGSSFQVRDDGPVPGGIWDDEEEKRFYEELIDLKEQVPSSLLGIKEKEVKAKPEDAETANGDAPPAAESGTADDADAKQQQEALQQAIDAMHLAENDAQQEAPAVGELELSRTASADGPSAAMSPAKAVVDLEDDKSTAVVTEDDGIQSGPAARLTALFAALPEASNREMVDKIALEFAFLNSKAARKRLVKVGLSISDGLEQRG